MGFLAHWDLKVRKLGFGIGIVVFVKVIASSNSEINKINPVKC